jgi:protein-tyrosine-phosphatase
VCTGNTARSPAAEYLANYYAEKYLVDLKNRSAGFINYFDHMQPNTLHYLEKKGIDISTFEPRLITKALLEKYDLILTMEHSHKEKVLENYSQIRDLSKKVFTLKEFNDPTSKKDILDPYYTSNEVYNKVLKLIDIEVKKAIQKIKRINEE